MEPLKKDEKKFEKSLQVQKKCLPLQSRYETRVPHRGRRRGGRGSRKGRAEARKYGEFIEKTEESTRKQVPNTKNESVDFFFLGIESAGLNLENKEIYKEEFDPGSG